MMASKLPAVLVAFASCATPALPGARYHNQLPVTVVDDRRHVERTPAKDEPLRDLYYYDADFHRRVTRALELPARRALGVNAVDEVPDSTWFTNRIGRRDLSADHVRAGATAVGSPEGHVPFTIHSSKLGGLSVGFIVSDARGEKYVLKFDARGFPEIETAAEVISDRLLWACGYNVPETHVVYLKRSDLRLAAGATKRDVLGRKHRLAERDVDAALARIEIDPDGRIRAMASRMLDGTALGGFRGEGTRADDPNDRIPHELRRDLRGLYVVFAWIDQLDVKQANTLDTWTTDPADPTRRYVKHYLIDVGKALGTMTVVDGDHRRGHEYSLDFAARLESLLTFGMRPRPWERRRGSALRGVGSFDATFFDPGAWKSSAPYPPFLLADRFDKFWGAKLVMRFTRDQLRAAVGAGRLTDPRASEYLVDALVARQRATGRHWFSRVNPLDRFELVTSAGGISLCFADLLLTYELAPLAPVTRYEITSYDRHARRIGPRRELAAARDGRTCTPALSLAFGSGDAYTIVRVVTRRPNFTGTTFVHLARDPSSLAFRVIGVWRI